MTLDELLETVHGLRGGARPDTTDMVVALLRTAHDDAKRRQR